jgi:NADPH2:quinone reductase
MKAVVVEKTGGIDVLQYKSDVPVPEPKEGEVLVHNEAVGINYIDTYFRIGLYTKPLPYIPGGEGSGTIASLGPGNIPSDLKPSTRVVYLGPSSYAQYTAVPTKYCIPIPDSISTETAAAAALQGLTALTLIREAHKVEKGDWVLVTAAAGGVGLWLCQLLKAVGARTIATASTPEKRQLALEHGAEVAVEYHEDDKDEFVKKVLGITGDEGVRAVFDSVGKATFDACLAVVGRCGTMVSFGNASGPVEGFALARLSAKNIKLLRPTLFNYVPTREDAIKYTNELWDLINKDHIKVNVHEVYPLADVKRATADIESRKTTGKLLLKP